MNMRNGWTALAEEHALLKEDYALLEKRLAELEEELSATKDLACRDPLTGLKNRRQIKDECYPRMVNLRRHHDRHYSIIMIDIDHFKKVNDTFGHDMGDAVLKKMAAVLKRNCRAGDDIVIRFGGEELTIVSFGPDHDGMGAEHLANRIWEDINSCPELVIQEGWRVTASIGVASAIVREFPKDGQPDDWNPESCFDKILRKADHAMYAAKGSGRNRIVVSGKEPVA
jgi:diguanylate cyclase (GGDEF)-like protein